MPSIRRRGSENSFLRFDDRGSCDYVNRGRQKRGLSMDAWEMFSELCKTVVEEQNVYLDILVTRNEIEFQLMPMGEEDEE